LHAWCWQVGLGKTKFVQDSIGKVMTWWVDPRCTQGGST
jgi:hypothetical protein